MKVYDFYIDPKAAALTIEASTVHPPLAHAMQVQSWRFIECVADGKTCRINLDNVYLIVERDI